MVEGVLWGSIKDTARQRFGNTFRKKELAAIVIQIPMTFQNAEALFLLDRRIFQLMISAGFPFSINENYSEREIIKALGIDARGGIRLSKKNNIIVLFFKPHTGRMTSDGGRNVYNDEFDESSGLCYYTGMGQIGDQTFDNPHNKWLRDAKEEGREIHLSYNNWKADCISMLENLKYVTMIPTKNRSIPLAGRET